MTTVKNLIKVGYENKLTILPWEWKFEYCTFLNVLDRSEYCAFLIFSHNIYLMSLSFTGDKGKVKPEDNVFLGLKAKYIHIYYFHMCKSNNQKWIRIIHHHFRRPQTTDIHIWINSLKTTQNLCQNILYIFALLQRCVYQIRLFLKKKKKYKLSQFQAICLTPFSSDELPFNIDRV